MLKMKNSTGGAGASWSPAASWLPRMAGETARLCGAGPGRTRDLPFLNFTNQHRQPILPCWARQESLTSIVLLEIGRISCLVVLKYVLALYWLS